MRVYLQSSKRASKKLIATLGSFDGFHLGHRELLRAVIKRANQESSASALITFHPHPRKIISGSEVPFITSRRQLILNLKDSGLEQFISLNFNNDLSNLSADEFIEQYLIKQFDISHLILGPYASIGKGREADANRIAEIFRAKGREASVLDLVADAQGNRISSSAIKEFLSAGQLEKVKTSLGRNFSVLSRVLHDRKLGRSIGVPTANLDIENYVLPPQGVYACMAKTPQGMFQAVANLGVRPTFGLDRKTLEVHLLDYNGPELYSLWLELFFVQRVRDEKKFPDINFLKEQIMLDIQSARDILNTTPVN